MIDVSRTSNGYKDISRQNGVDCPNIWAKSIIMNKTICIAGKNNIAVNVLLHCIGERKDIRVIVVCNRNDSGENGWQKSLLWYAKKNGIDVMDLEEVYHIPSLIFLSLEFDRIIQPDLFCDAKLYNIHFSLLPKYKGCHTSVLPILYGEKKTGCTFHYIDKGIDTGEIIEQVEVEILPSDTSHDLYNRLTRIGTNLVIKNLPKVIQGNEVSWKQNPYASTYYSRKKIDYNELHLEINSTANQIKNQVHAFSFRPFQFMRWNNIDYVFCEILDTRSDLRPGTILADTEAYTIIASVDYNIKMYKDVLAILFEAIKKFDNGKAKELCLIKHIINAQDKHGWSPLTVAIYVNNVEIANHLMLCGADMNVRDWSGKTTLMYAMDCGIRTGDWTLFRTLVNRKIDINKRDYSDCSLKDYVVIDKVVSSIPKDIQNLLDL